jgi:anti-sigma B factor antagonist
MSTPAAQISVMAGKQFACVKIQGRANFTASLDFSALLNQLRERGLNYFVIELSECALMDSTFLGVLAGFGLKMGNGNGHPATGCVELRNANARITELLENIGVLHLFKSAQGALESPEALEACAHLCREASRQEVTETCLKAHETLMAINPDNVARFKDVTKFLAEDLARMNKPTP